MYQNRSKYEVFYEILNQLNNGNCQECQLISCTNKPRAVFDGLMNTLVSQGFLLEFNGYQGKQYKITENGVQFYKILSTTFSLVDVQGV